MVFSCSQTLLYLQESPEIILTTMFPIIYSLLLDLSSSIPECLSIQSNLINGIAFLNAMTHFEKHLNLLTLLAGKSLITPAN